MLFWLNFLALRFLHSLLVQPSIISLLLLLVRLHEEGA